MAEGGASVVEYRKQEALSSNPNTTTTTTKKKKKEIAEFILNYRNITVLIYSMQSGGADQTDCSTFPYKHPTSWLFPLCHKACAS
jgi:hypothetical protein